MNFSLNFKRRHTVEKYFNFTDLLETTYFLTYLFMIEYIGLLLCRTGCPKKIHNSYQIRIDI